MEEHSNIVAHNFDIPNAAGGFGDMANAAGDRARDDSPSKLVTVLPKLLNNNKFFFFFEQTKSQKEKCTPGPRNRDQAGAPTFLNRPY